MRRVDGRENIEIKVTLVGGQGVGKSALLIRFKNGVFHSDIVNTIGAHFATLERPSRDGKAIVKVNVWDTAGMERFKSLVPMYIRGASVVLICFESPRVSDIVEHIEVIKQTNEYCDIILVQTKIDDPESNKARTSEVEDVEAFVKRHGYKFYKTSAKTGTGVNILFEECIEKCYSIKKGTEPEKNIVVVSEATVVTKGYSYSSCCSLM